MDEPQQYTLHEQLNFTTEYAIFCSKCPAVLHSHGGRVPIINEAEEAGWAVGYVPPRYFAICPECQKPNADAIYF